MAKIQNPIVFFNSPRKREMRDFLKKIFLNHFQLHRWDSILALLVFSLISLVSCKIETNKTEVETGATTSGLALTHIDSTIAPGDDFSGFANGKWNKTAEMYPGTPFNGNMIKLTFDTEHLIGEILQEVLKEDDYPVNSPKGQIQAFYKSYMDTLTRNQLGIKPIEENLNRIFAVKSRAELAGLMGTPLAPSIVKDEVFLDAKNTTNYIFIIEQKDLGIESIEYYLVDIPTNDAVREAYQKYVEKLFTLAGIDHP